ncbi:MAG TPA: hypothetical protein VGO62_13390 [Myxococcota bacterium]|jgi:type III secretion protein J
MKHLALLAVLGLASACGGQQQIVHGLDETEANEIMVVLEAKGIGSEKVELPGRTITYAVQVAEVDSHDAMRLLVANHLPRERSATWSTVYPAGGGGLIPTKSEERAKFLMAIEGEIEKKLKTLPGIVKAHVSIVQPEKDIVRDLDQAPTPSTASVAIVYNAIDDRGTAAVTEPDVQRLVAAAVEDLKPSNVTVLMKRNVPVNLVDVYAESGNVETPVAAVKLYGIRLADKGSAARLNTYGGILLIVAVLSLAVGVGGIVRSMGLRRRASKAEADLTSMRRARKDTQTGLQGQSQS